MNMPDPQSDAHFVKRETILAEATRLFNEMGYADTRLEDIGTSLRTTKTSVSYYFKSKERLLSEVYERAIGFSEKAMEDAHSQANGLEAVLFWVAAHARAHADALSGVARPIAVIADLSAITTGDQTSVASRYLALIAKCWQLIGRGIDDQSIDVPSRPAALFFILNMLHWLPRWLGDVRRADRDAATQGLVDLLGSGLAVDRARHPPRSIVETHQQDADIGLDRASWNRMKRDAFLRAGTRALNAGGFRSLSLNNIATELGVSRGAFYSQFADKNALLLGCFERSCQIIETGQRLAHDPSMSALDQLERCLRWLFERQASDLDPLARISLLSALDGKTRLLMAARLNRLRMTFAEMIAHGMIDGSIRQIEISAIEQLVMGSVFASSHRRQILLRDAISDPDVTREISSAGYYAVLLNGLSGGRTVPIAPALPPGFAG